MDIYDITASAMTAQRMRMDAISSNLANVNTTRKTDGSLGAYHRKNTVFAPLMNEAQGRQKGELNLELGEVGKHLDAQGNTVYEGGVSAKFRGMGVSVVQIKEDNETPMRLVYDPSHPDANKDGFVEYPNVNAVNEMVDMISASRAYEASVTAFQSTKAMNEATLNM
jgi:flagellar basal-body rod protein FlgC